MNRQAATSKGIRKRLKDADFLRVNDSRQKGKVKITLPTILVSLAAGMVTMARSLRTVEQRTAQFSSKLSKFFTRKKRIADNTFGKILPRLDFNQLIACLHRLVKKEQRRKNLNPIGFPWGIVAIDGKNNSTLHWYDLCRVLNLDEHETSAQEVKIELNKTYPQAQLHIPEEGKPYALLRMHTATLISPKAALPIHLRPIPECTNEIGALPVLLDELKSFYGRSKIFSVITTDAGNTSWATCGQIIANCWHYFSQIKSTAGNIHQVAKTVLDKCHIIRAQATSKQTQNGKLIEYFIFCYPLSDNGCETWLHARQLVRVCRRTTVLKTGEQTVGNRYYVTDLDKNMLSPSQALRICRHHWRCENENHWTCDSQLNEDLRKLSWSRHPDGLLSVAAIRMMALFILAIARSMSRFGNLNVKPSWRQVSEHFLLLLCGTALCTEDFDNV